MQDGQEGIVSGPGSYGVSMFRNEIINATLTENDLPREAIQAQQEMASSPNHTTAYIPMGNNGIPIVYNPN